MAVIATNGLICQTQNEQSQCIFPTSAHKKTTPPNCKPTFFCWWPSNIFQKLSQKKSKCNNPLKMLQPPPPLSCLSPSFVNLRPLTQATQNDFFPDYIWPKKKRNHTVEPTRTQPCRTYRLHIPDNRGIVLH